uniref:NADH-ubiquinone oxidoreductase chain 2 n=1 Tax=Polytoxus fuscovittatus TaxID=1347745 RepID=A0A7I6HL61_9HEMI|nr:NADH dehydrogenase subunit 2 [Polytoxus fuscovittatus]
MKLNNINLMMFWMLMITGTMMVMSTNKWIIMWVGLEMNMMGFIPMLHKMKNIYSSESMIIYFSIQSMGSLIMLITIMMSSNYNFFNNIIMMGIMIKLGSAPFHFWLPEMMNKMNWKESLILMTWQKLAPLMTLTQLNFNPQMFIFTILNVTMGVLGSIGQTSIYKIMAYSSINHLGWMIMSITYSQNLWINYMMIYTMNLIPIMYMMNINSIKYINQFNMMKMSMTQKLTIIFLMISLGGMPPMIGFYPKWLIVKEMMENNDFMIIYMIMMSLIMLFIYMRMTSTMLMLNSMNKKIKHKNNYMWPMIIFINIMLPMYLMK